LKDKDKERESHEKHTALTAIHTKATVRLMGEAQKVKKNLSLSHDF
jgi:hypothetical protein